MPGLLDMYGSLSPTQQRGLLSDPMLIQRLTAGWAAPQFSFAPRDDNGNNNPIPGIGTRVASQVASPSRFSALVANPAAGLANIGGGIGGGLLGNMVGDFGRNTTGQIGGGLGSGGGALLGQALIPIPGVGAAVGAFGGNILGRALGGLFGGKPSVGPGGGSNVRIADGQAVGEFANGDNGYGPNSGSSLALARQSAQALNALAASRGKMLTPEAAGGIGEQGGRLWIGFGGPTTDTTRDRAVADFVRAAVERGGVSGLTLSDLGWA
jgi:hypothetical protein